jgi:DNA-directed RNA polymerase subunit M/transcription elongation factor TFIIS
MMKLHGCKKCQGALILDKDEYGWFEECIQCGYTRDVPLDILCNTPEVGDLMPVTVISSKKNPAEAWKQNKISYYTPLKNTDDPEENAY